MSRRNIYYWKCDRPNAFHATTQSPGLEARLAEILQMQFGPCELRPGSGQGNHLTFRTVLNGHEAFIRVEDGPERDDYMGVESHVLGLVRQQGVPTPLVLGFDASRQTAFFAWQALENIPQPDLNAAWKEGTLDSPRVAEQIGGLIARWQEIKPAAFGPFDSEGVRKGQELRGLHARYEDYFNLRLDDHLDFLREREFLPAATVAEIRRMIADSRDLLQMPQGVLVHKDLALWNVLGTPDKVTAVIDWDDCISGDPMDDLSLLACFHDAGFLASAIRGYAAVRPLPDDWQARFWLHLLRNMIVKSVIRVGAGYFERTNSFFLIGSGQDGTNLREFTLARLHRAWEGLREHDEIHTL
jgi:fructosamine-3-kinase